jgi:16S rRNA processing protein RimM
MTVTAGEPAHLVVGQIVKPHGTKGEVFVWPLTDAPDEVFEDGRELLLGDAAGELEPEPATIVIERSRPFKRGVLAKLVGREDRTAVEPLAGRYVLAATASLRPLEAGELYYHQLLGVRVEAVDGTDVGVVKEVFETEPAHLLDVEAPDGKRHLVPFVERIVVEIDAAGRRLVIRPPPGLLEL